MSRATHIIVTCCLIAVGALAAERVDKYDFIRVTPTEVRWQDIPDGHGAQRATLEGDPDKPGMYVVRVKFPPHVMDLPHWHPNARYVTVLQGTWYAGTGTVFDVAKAIPTPPGSFMLHPARAPHWDGSAGEEAVIVQIIGYGPSEGELVDPKKPYWIDVSR